MHTTVLTLWIAGSVTKINRFLALPKDVTTVKMEKWNSAHLLGKEAKLLSVAS